MTWVLLAQVESLSGSSGWVGAGLLGLVLSWLLLKHLPEKDQQLRALLDIQAAERKEDRDSRQRERDLDRDARHKAGSDHLRIVGEIYENHREENRLERESFESRVNGVIQAIKQQTDDLREVMTHVCHSKDEGGT